MIRKWKGSNAILWTCVGLKKNIRDEVVKESKTFTAEAYPYLLSQSIIDYNIIINYCLIRTTLDGNENLITITRYITKQKH